MKKQHYYLLLALVSIFGAVGFLALGVMGIRELGLPFAGCMAGMIGGFALASWATYKGAIAMWDDPKSVIAQPQQVRSDNGDPDPKATRQWVEQVIDSKTANCIRMDGETYKSILNRIRETAEEWYYAWVFIAPDGEKAGRIMWGRPGMGYQCVPGIYAFVEGSDSSEGPRVFEIKTPSQGCMDAYREEKEKAEWDYTTSGGGHYWSPETATIKIGKGDAIRLLSSLPQAAKFQEKA